MALVVVALVRLCRTARHRRLVETVPRVVTGEPAVLEQAAQAALVAQQFQEIQTLRGSPREHV
jgi:hypothetical protein